MSAARSFFDTNILLYTDDAGDVAKQTRALDLIQQHRASRSGVVSLQVLQEYFSAATSKLRLEPASARRKVEVFARFDVVIPGVNDVLAAIDLHRLHQLAFWDALIVRAARNGGCSILFSEDMQHGRTIDGLHVVNPFL